MPLKIRLARHGSKKKPFYRLVVATSTAPRNGAFIEKVGIYNPMLDKATGKRVELNAERIAHWLKCGAQPTDSVKRFLVNAGLYQLSDKDKARLEELKAAQAAKKAAEAAA